MKKVWDQKLEGHQIFRLVKRLKYLKRRTLNSQHFRNIITEPGEDKAELHHQSMDKALQEQEKKDVPEV